MQPKNKNEYIIKNETCNECVKNIQRANIFRIFEIHVISKNGDKKGTVKNTNCKNK